MNHMQFIKCGVNSSLHNSGCCIRSVAPWITVLSWHTVFTKRVIHYKFTFVRYSANQGTTHRPMSHLAHCVPLLWPWEEHRRLRRWVGDFAGQCLLWQLLLFSLLLLLFLLFFLLKIIFHIGSLCTWFPESVLQPEFHCWLPPQVLFIFFWPVLDMHNRLPCLDYYVRASRHSCRNVIPVRYEHHLQWQQNRSKATMWLL